MKNLFVLSLLLISSLLVPCDLVAQKKVSSIKNATTFVKPYTGEFKYGSNIGYYGTNWNDKELVTILSKANGHSVRASLPDHFLEQYGYNIRLQEFRSYLNDLGMGEITCFIGGPSPAHQDKKTYPGASEPSKLFANLYEPIWQPNGQVNPKNYYANYVYKVLKTYGQYIRFWEVVNEPDFIYDYNLAPNWLKRAPLPAEMPNTRAPFYHYVRMLRITWEVVKKYQPEDYVTIGGIGYSEFLDALLRYTDNPNGGGISPLYPFKGGAYFDVLSFHVYPSYTLKKWNNKKNDFDFFRTSDYAAAEVINHKNSMEAVLKKYGYSGSPFPKKHVIITETNIARRSVGPRTGTDEMQRNFGIKTLVLAQKNQIAQLYFYDLGESETAPTTSDIPEEKEYKLMGLYQNLQAIKPGSEKFTPWGIAFKTTTSLLYGFQYDPDRTAKLKLPANVEGAAFKKNNQYTYVMWAKALQDNTEVSSSTFSFPSTWNITQLNRFEWDYASTGKNTKSNGKGIKLTSSPSFFR